MDRSGANDERPKKQTKQAIHQSQQTTPIPDIFGRWLIYFCEPAVRLWLERGCRCGAVLGTGPKGATVPLCRRVPSVGETARVGHPVVVFSTEPSLPLAWAGRRRRDGTWTCGV